MTPDPDKLALKCLIPETITATGTDSGTGATVAFDLSTDGKGPGLPPPFDIQTGSQRLSIAIGYPTDSGGLFTLTLTSTTGEQQVYRFTQVHNTQDGAVIEFHT
jgi:hypothetical protein